MRFCTACGAELPEGARFCPGCGTPVAIREEPVSVEERRVVSVLFADIVGFTERSDRADPEDVRRTLVPFHARAKEDIERFGGTLDKFIGDAVMGVFGAPIAHEDDPVRAVRAALAILGSVERLRRDDPNLSVRIGVNTGEALVSLGRGPQVGEAVAGDVVNTASRMQSVAPPGTVVVGETTLRGLRDRFEAERLDPIAVKGKAEPLIVWRILAEHEAPAAVPAPPTFVGRERELAILAESLTRAERLGRTQVVTVLAEPGLGKSRLVEEFRLRVRGRTRLLVGRCAAYGDVGALGSVAELLRALAGLEPSDATGVVLARLEALASAAEADPAERRWIVSRISSVLSVLDPGTEGTIPPVEIGDACARVFGAATGDGPLVLVVEDLHWADDVLVTVVEAVVDALAERPVLLVVTARPDRVERHERWGARGWTTVELRPLEPEDTEDLIASLASGAVPASLVERTGGNPLYAVEFMRMLGDRTREAERLETPETVQAVLAARLDALGPSLGALVLDAAVLGEELWPEALATLGDREADEVRGGLDTLVRRGVMTPLAASSLRDLRAYAFSHSLMREVAYGRLPRAARARRHLIAGRWLERRVGPGVEMHADVLAHHFGAAAELAIVAGEEPTLAEARAPAVRWLLLAGEQAARLDVAGAFATFERALSLCDMPRDRFEALRRSALAGRQSGRLEASEVLSRYEEALDIARALGDPELQGIALTRLGSQLGAMGESVRALQAHEEAIRVLEGGPPGRPLALAYAYRAEDELFAGRVPEAIDLADRALALLEPDDELAAMALHIRGDGRCSSGDVGGIQDLERALRISEANQITSDIVTSANYLAEWRWGMDGPEAAISAWTPFLELAERRGMVSQGLWGKASILGPLWEAGEWDRALDACGELLAVPPERLDAALLLQAHSVRSKILLERGRRDEVADHARLLETAHRLQELQGLVPVLLGAAALAVADGDRDRAIRYLGEIDRLTRDVAPEYRCVELARATRLAIEAGDLALADRLVDGSEPRVRRDLLQAEAARAALAEVRSEPEATAGYLALAERWRIYGHPFEEALALLGAARCIETTDATEARAARGRADELRARLGIGGQRG